MASSLRTTRGLPLDHAEEFEEVFVDPQAFLSVLDTDHANAEQPTSEIEARPTTGLRYTQEVQVLTEIFASLASSQGQSRLHSSSLSEIETRLNELLAVVLERGQTDRAELLLSFSDQLKNVLASFQPLRLSTGSQSASSNASTQQLIRSSIDESTLASFIQIVSPARVGTLRASSGLVANDCASSSDVDCPICYDQIPASSAVTLESCRQHFYCSDCLSKHLSSLIGGTEGRAMQCPEPNCSAMPLDSDVQRFVSPELYSTYLQSMVLATMKNAFFCPNLQCSQLSFWNTLSRPCIVAQCPYCQSLACTRCQLLYHPLLTCEEAQRGLESLEEQLAEWMDTTSYGVKACPSCHCPTEKTDGCNHVRSSASLLTVAPESPLLTSNFFRATFVPFFDQR